MWNHGHDYYLDFPWTAMDELLSAARFSRFRKFSVTIRDEANAKVLLPRLWGAGKVVTDELESDHGYV